MNPENPTLNNRILYLDCLRIIASVAVMMLHIAAQNWYSDDLHSLSWHALNVYNSATRWCVPVFVMISGALFLPRDVSAKTLYTKYILRLVIAYAAWGVIYSLINPLLGLADFSAGYMLRTVITGAEHMWFIPMIIGMYMCVPLLRPIARDRKLAAYFLLLAFLFQFLRPIVFNLTRDFVGGLAAEGTERLQTLFSSMSLHSVLGYAGYFVAGYVLSQTELSPKLRRIFYALGILGLLATVGLTILASYRSAFATGTYYDYFSLNVALMAAALFVRFKYGVNGSVRAEKTVLCLSKYSFGAYLVHVLMIDVVKFIGLNTSSFNAFLSVPVMTLIVAAVSFAVSFVLNQIPVVKKYLV